jgi:hypothetical protein
MAEANRYDACYVLNALEVWEQHKCPAVHVFTSLVNHLLQERLANKSRWNWPAQWLTFFDYALYALEKLASQQSANAGTVLHCIDQLCRREQRLGIPQSCVRETSPSCPAPSFVDRWLLLQRLLPIHQWALPTCGRNVGALRRRWVAQVERRCIPSLCGVQERRALHSQLGFSWAYATFLFTRSEGVAGEGSGDKQWKDAAGPHFTISLDSLLSDAAYRVSSQHSATRAAHSIDCLIPAM